MHIVYALVKDEKCVYVGCTTSIKNRLSKHKINKNFDSYIEISRHNSKNEALLAERSIIKFLSIFGSSELYNAKYSLLSYEAIFHHNIKESKNNY